jgi:hypothetical protein
MIQPTRSNSTEQEQYPRTKSEIQTAANTVQLKCAQKNEVLPAPDTISRQQSAQTNESLHPEIDLPKPGTSSTVQTKISESRANRTSVWTKNLPNWISKRSKATAQTLDYCADRWAFEILSCTFALLCLLAIIVTLVTHQDQSLPQWPRMISINSLIAIFTALMKAALMVPIAEGEKN